MKTMLSVLFTLLIANMLFGQDVNSLAGHQAPPIIFKESLSKNTPPNFYQNKILVIDFWATWCAPCIATFPHFNQLSKKYGSDSVLFASLTDEPASIARKFFERTKKELIAVKLCDTSHKTGNSFNVQSIPYCVVIDKNNIVRWTGQTYDLTEEVLNNIIKNTAQPEKQPPIAMASNEKPESLSKRTYFSFSISKSDTINGHEGGSSRTYKSSYLELSLTNTTLGSCLEQLTGFSKSARIVSNDSIKMKQLIDLDFKAGKDTTLFSSYKNTVLTGAARNNMIISLIGEALKFDIKVITKKNKHYELIVADSAKLHRFASMNARHSSFDADHFPDFEIVGYTLKAITVNLEESMKTIITTDIEDNTRYDISLDISNIKTANKTMEFHGLKLIPIDNDVDFLIVNFR